MRRLLTVLLVLALSPLPAVAQSVILSQYGPGQKTSANSLPVVLPSDQTVAISVASLPLPTGAATEATLSGLLTNEQSALTSLQTIDNLVLLEDGVHSSGESGVLILGVRNDAGTALAADLDRIPLSLDSSGAVRVTGGGGGVQYTEADVDATITGTAMLWEDASNTLRPIAAGTPLPVTCPTCSGSGVQHVDNNPFTGASDDVVPLGALFDATPPAVTDGNVGVIRMGSDRILLVTISGTPTVTVGTFPDNEPFNLAQVGGVAVGAANPLMVRQSDGTTAQTWSALDLDSAGGTVTRIAVGLAAAASGGPIAIEGTTANGLEVDVTRVQGTVTVDTELGSAITLAANLSNPTVPGMGAYMLCQDAGGLWDPCLQSLLTEATHDAALTVASTIGAISMLRASSTEPTNISANDDAVLPWGLPSGAGVVTLVDSTGAFITDTANTAVRVNIVAGAAAGGTSSNFGSALPGAGTAIGFSDGTNMQAGRVADADLGGGFAYTQIVNLVRRVSGGPAELIGSSTSANSLPVVIANDQAAVTVTATNLSTNLAQVAGTTTVTAGVSGLLAVGGGAAHDATASGHPLLMGGVSGAAAPADVSADGEAVRSWHLRNGQQVIQLAYSGTLAAVNNGASSAATQRVTLANDSTGVLASISTSVTPGTAAGQLGKAVDDVAGGTDTGVLLLAVRDDTLGALTPADGDYTQLRVNSTGALHVTGAGGGTQYVEDTASAGAETMTLAGAIRQDTLASSTSADGDFANLKVNATGALYVTGGGGGTEYVVNAVTPADPTGTTLVMERDDALSALTEIEGDWTNPRANANGALWVAHDPTVTLVANVTQWGSTSVVTGGVAGSVGLGGLAAHDAAVSGNPVLLGGYASAAAPTDVTADGEAVRFWALRSGALVSQLSFAGTLAAVNNGTASAGTIRVTVASDSTGTLASIGSITTAIVPGTGATNLGKAIDSVAGGTDTGVVALAMRDDDLASTITPVEGDWTQLRVDSVGYLWTRGLAAQSGNWSVAITNVAGTGIAVVDDASYGIASTPVLAAGYLADETATDSVNEGDLGAARMTLDRKLIITPYAHTAGGADAIRYISVGTTEDEHAVKATAGTLYSVTVTNTNAAARYLKCEDDTAANTAPGTDTPEFALAIPGATSGAGFSTTFPVGWSFVNALTCWVVTGAADADVAEVAANEILIFYTYK